MREYIISDDQLVLIADPSLRYVLFPDREELIDPESGETVCELKRIDRCRDCKHKYGCVHLIEVQQEDGDGDMIRCKASPDGYCWWGERAAFVTCKCGEEIEAFGRVQTCPSCGRRLMA